MRAISYVVIFGGCSDNQREPLLVDALDRGRPGLSDGTRTVAEILDQFESERSASPESDSLNWIEMLFRSGLLGLRSQISRSGRTGKTLPHHDLQARPLPWGRNGQQECRLTPRQTPNTT